MTGVTMALFGVAALLVGLAIGFLLSMLCGLAIVPLWRIPGRASAVGEKPRNCAPILLQFAMNAMSRGSKTPR